MFNRVKPIEGIEIVLNTQDTEQVKHAKWETVVRNKGISVVSLLKLVTAGNDMVNI